MQRPVAAPVTAPGDVRTIAAVGAAHFTSHILQIALPPLFPLMRDGLGVGFTELGLLLTVFYIASGAGQVLAGVLVDRFGAAPLLLSGIVLQAVGIGAMSLAPDYSTMLPLAAVAGLGNSVYHPADLSILSHRVSPSRLGRAFAVHVICGAAGFALSPIFVGVVGSAHGWRAALASVSIIALVIGAAIGANRAALVTPGHHAKPGLPAPHGAAAAGGPSFWQIVAMPVVLMAFCFFTLTAFAGGGIQGFTIAALIEGYGANLTTATLAITAYQIGGVCGVLLGGYAADRTQNHHYVAMAGMAAAAVLTLAAASTALPLAVIAALLAASGFAGGITTPSRDVLVRQAAPGAGLGKVFGVVYSGFDVGSLIAPLILGAMLDRHMPQLVFVVAAGALAIATVTVMGVRARPAPAGKSAA